MVQQTFGSRTAAAGIDRAAVAAPRRRAPGLALQSPAAAGLGPRRASAYVASGPRLSDLGTPLLTLDAGALDHNLRTMAAWCHEAGVALAPHGKTTMAPALWQAQLDAGAIGITLANLPQLHVARAFGVQRVMLANALLDPAGLAVDRRRAGRRPGLRVRLLGRLGGDRHPYGRRPARRGRRHRPRSRDRPPDRGARRARRRRRTHRSAQHRRGRRRRATRCRGAARCGSPASQATKARSPTTPSRRKPRRGPGLPARPRRAAPPLSPPALRDGPCRRHGGRQRLLRHVAEVLVPAAAGSGSRGRAALRRLRHPRRRLLPRHLPVVPRGAGAPPSARRCTSGPASSPSPNRGSRAARRRQARPPVRRGPARCRSWSRALARRPRSGDRHRAQRPARVPARRRATTAPSAPSSGFGLSHPCTALDKWH